LSFIIGSLALSAPIAVADVTVTDDLGRVISLEQPAQRIISLYGAHSEILFAMGVGDRLVARTRADHFPPAILDKPSVGTHLRPNIELVLGLEPDLIIQAAGRKHGHEVIRQLQQKGLTVASFQPATFEELFSVVRRLGTLTGKEQAAGALVKNLEARLQRLSRRLLNSEGRPTVFFEVRYPNLLGAGRQSIVNDVILKAGGTNCLPNQKKLVRINIETLVGYDPDVYVVQMGPMNRNPGDPKDRSNFQVLKAVRGGRVMFVDEHLFSRPGPRSVEAVEILAAFLHPE
jgi:iron complex transport system substrate-binding protein